MSYDNDCSDPDYYNIEFREQNPEVYGDDELMQSYRNSRYNGKQNKRYSNYSRKTGKKDDSFHQDYLQWRKDHQDKIKFFRSPSGSRYNGDATTPIWPSIIIGIIVYSVLIFAIVTSCD